MLTIALVISAAAFAHEEPHHALPFNAKGTALEPLTKLAGDWAKTSSFLGVSGRPTETTVTYRVTSNGSAVQETLLPRQPDEDLSMYTLDDGVLIMTHYCALGSQPRLQGTPVSDDPLVIVFTLVDGQNLDATGDEYVGKMTLTILDDGHIRQEWRRFKGANDVGGVEMELRRIWPGMR